MRTVDGHKYSRCLGTDKGKAERAWPDVFASLGPERPRLYHPQELITITEWDPSTGTAQEVTREAQFLLSNRQLTEDSSREPTPAEDAWDLAAEEARRRYRRKRKSEPSASWERQVRHVRKFLPAGVLPRDLTPQHVRRMMHEMEGAGHSDSSISTRIATLSGLLTSLIKSGIEPDMVNVCRLVDYSSPSEKSYATASDEDYRRMAEFMREEPTMQLMMYLGLRIGEALHAVIDSDGNCVISDGHEDGWKPKNKTSYRTLPLPFEITPRLEDIRAFRRRFDKARGEGSELVPHSFRHGFIQLSRQVDANPLVMEAVVGHKLPSAMMALYGDGFKTETMERECRKIWNRVQELTK